VARSSGGSAGAVVTGLVAAALAVVGFFAYQAAAAPDRVDRGGAHAAGGGASGASHSPSPEPSASATPPSRVLPDHSGTGRRVVYGLQAQRVWLVGADGTVQRTFKVWPSTVDPAPGPHQVTSRSAQVTGSDGVPVEHVVRFARAEGTTVGFSAATNGSAPSLDPTKKTGGVREKRADGAAMWTFATTGTKVVVVP
jgi:hypothetical protein